MKTLSIHVIALLLLACALMTSTLPASENAVVQGALRNRMKLLSQAVELWANDHNSQFPTVKEFKGATFKPYLHKAGWLTGGGNALRCPGTKLNFIYEPRQAEKNYIISCPPTGKPTPSILSYSRNRGFFLVEKSPASSQASHADKVKPNERTGAIPAAVSSAMAAREVSKEDKDKVTAIITQLHAAYAAKDLDKIMELVRYSVEYSALDYEKRGKGPAQEVREAFRDATREIIEHKDYKLYPLNMSDVTFDRKGKYIKVTSVVPIILTDQLEIINDDKFFYVKLRVGEIIFEPAGDSWRIANLYLY
jgi:hypothetical protein